MLETMDRGNLTLDTPCHKLRHRRRGGPDFLATGARNPAFEGDRGRPHTGVVRGASPVLIFVNVGRCRLYQMT